MTFTTSNFLLLAAIILIFSILITKTGYKFGVPSLLIFLIVGMIFGEDGLGIHYDNYNIAQFIGMIALTIILFTGGMGTRFNDIRPILGPGLTLSTVGVLLTTVFTGFFIFGIGQVFNDAITLPLTFAILLAATMSSTDSASVFSIIRSQKMKMHHNLQPLLELESGSNDPMAYMLTIVMIQVIQNSGDSDISVVTIILTFIIQFALGFFNGYVFGRIYVLIHNRLKLENKALYQILIVGFIFLTFAITDSLGGNGYLAVYIAGIVTGNAGMKTGKELKIKDLRFNWFGDSRLIERRNIEKLLDGLVWMVQIIMFLNLGLLVNPSEMLDIAVPAVIIGLFVIIIGRPLAVWLCLIPFKKISAKDKVFVSWVGLRGAAPIIFATYPMVADVEDGKLIFNIVFFITLLSLIIQGTTIPFMARKLNLGDIDNSSPENFGVEIPDEINALMQMQIVKNEALLKDYPLPQGTLVMFVKRDNNYLVPNGSIFLRKGDEILLISKDNEPEIADEPKN